MKKILITRKLIKESEEKAIKTFDPIFNTNDELYSQSKVIEMSQGCDGILNLREFACELPSSWPPARVERWF